MDTYQHLNLPIETKNIERQKKIGGGGYAPQNRDKKEFFNQIEKNTKKITNSYRELKNKHKNIIDPNLIYRIKINQSVDVRSFEKIFLSSGIHLISVAPSKKGYWVVFSDEKSLMSFKQKLAQHAGIQKGQYKYDYFNAIETLEDIPIAEKIGFKLKNEPLSEDEETFLDVEFWRIDDTRKLKTFIDDLAKVFQDNFRIYDKLITKSFAKARIKTNKTILYDLLEFKEVLNADRPPKISRKNFEYNQIDIDEFNIQAPQTNSTGILILDSGIISNNPFLADCVGDAQNFQEIEPDENDNVGHGTAVAGCAAYGNIDKCIDNKEFIASNYIFSGKIMYAEKDWNGNVINVTYNHEKLIESQYDDAIRYFLNNDTFKIKVVNISFGNLFEVFVSKTQRQFPLASLIDDLAKEYADVVFVISAGNQLPQNIFENLGDIKENYPDYLIENENFKIINPATSALSLTVGSISSSQNHPVRKNSFTEEDIWLPIAGDLEPSPFTRTGYGVNGMVKPELVEIGGNCILREQFGRIVENTGGHIALISHDVEKSFAFDYGTSYSAPKVANILGKLTNIYPERSGNFIKNMLLQSASYDNFINLESWNDTQKVTNNLKLQGYGRPNFERAISSFKNRVVLIDEGNIGLDKIKIFSFPIPHEFFSNSGRKRISVALTYNPETRITRGDSYVGNVLDFKIFHSISSEELKAKFANLDGEEVQVPEDLRKREIVLKPGTTTRKAGCHQKGVKEYKRNPKNIQNSPFFLVLFNLNKWIVNEDYLQEYCISVTVEHSEDVDLYNTIRNKIREKIQIK